MYLIFCLHSHQPIGNFEDVFERAYNRAYKPFLDVFERYKDIKINLHYSGCLLEWFLEKKPEFLERIKNLISEGRIELLGGGFYEPILPIIPRADAKGQLKMMNDFLKTNFNIEPSGFWLPERIWEPIIPEIAFPLKYTTVDDTHFLFSGIPADKLSGYFLTEEQGNTLAIFPIDKNLRYFIPFRKADEVIGYLKTREDMDLTMGDDLEKFGLWPGTYKWVYEEKWLEGFFSLLLENRVWLKTETFSNYLKDFPPSGKAYLPCCSYEEMTEWALLLSSNCAFHNIIEELKRAGIYDRAREFLRGGYFRNFFIKYPEADHLHKRMVFASSIIGENDEARKFIYKAQCNCAYWHGIFGGLYTPHLRKAIYSNIIKAENLALSKDIVIEKDINNDLKNEIYIKKSPFALIIEPHNGGVISEIDGWGRNITDIISRREEAYHKRLHNISVPEEPKTQTIHDIKKDISPVRDFLFYDQYTHRFLQDHIFSPDTSLKALKEGSLSWLFKPFERPYTYQIKDFSISLKYEDEGITIDKEIFLNKDSMQFIYKTNGISGLFAVEFCFSVIDPEEREIRGKEIKTKEIVIKSDKELLWWKMPLYTVSQSETGFDITQQGIIVMALILLEKERQWNVNYHLGFSTTEI